ncbi:MAG: response regulator transcription factor [Xanthomonadaceae bacterium]|nr:response regulator transcription factor [Xanthomonadaceae bacterium]
MSTNGKILIVEDESDIRDLMMLHLTRAGYECLGFSEVGGSLDNIKTGDISLAIVDWMLPDISGLELIRQIRRVKTSDALGVLMVTAKGEPSDVILGLEVGADDYLIKPFDVQVLTARVRALMRRISVSKEVASHPKSILTLGKLSLNTDSFEATIDGEKVPLTKSEFMLLQVLLENRGKVLSREKLMDCIQGEGVNTVDRVIDTHVFGLRKKIGEVADQIETVRGIGYRVKWE